MSLAIYDVLREAEGDENQNAAPANDAPAGAGQNQNQTGGDNDNANAGGGDDDFNMDMSLDDTDTEGGGDDAAPADDTGDIDAGGDMGSDTNEPIDANTDIFYSLTAEEQTMKIMELKGQYSSLFNACDDLIEKLGDIDNNENTIQPLSRITGALIDLKSYIMDYLYHKFDINSYYENDVKLNEFISVFHSISEIMKEIYKINIQNA